MSNQRSVAQGTAEKSPVGSRASTFASDVSSDAATVPSSILSSAVTTPGAPGPIIYRAVIRPSVERFASRSVSSIQDSRIDSASRRALDGSEATLKYARSQGQSGSTTTSVRTGNDSDRVSQHGSISLGSLITDTLQEEKDPKFSQAGNFVLLKQVFPIEGLGSVNLPSHDGDVPWANQSYHPTDAQLLELYSQDPGKARYAAYVVLRNLIDFWRPLQGNPCLPALFKGIAMWNPDLKDRSHRFVFHATHILLDNPFPCEETIGKLREDQEDFEWLREKWMIEASGYFAVPKIERDTYYYPKWGLTQALLKKGSAKRA